MNTPVTPSSVCDMQEREAFERDAEPMGFDLTRHYCAAPEPWSQYKEIDTGNRWGGWLARAALAERTQQEAQPPWCSGGCCNPEDRPTSAADCTAQREHTASADCWCEPEVDYVDPDTGATVYVHKGTQ